MQRIADARAAGDSAREEQLLRELKVRRSGAQKWLIRRFAAASNDAMRAQLLGLLCAICDASATQFLLDACRGPFDWSVRSLAIGKLLELRCEAFLAIAERIVLDEAQHADRVAFVLHKMHLLGEPGIRELMHWLRDPKFASLEKTVSAGLAISGRPECAAELVKRWRERYDPKDPWGSAHLVAAMTTMPAAAVRVLIEEIIDDPAIPGKNLVISRLRHMEPELAADLLARTLDRLQSPAHRAQALIEAGLIRHPRAGDVLLDMLSRPGTTPLEGRTLAQAFYNRAAMGLNMSSAVLAYQAHPDSTVRALVSAAIVEHGNLAEIESDRARLIMAEVEAGLSSADDTVARASRCAYPAILAAGSQPVDKLLSYYSSAATQDDGSDRATIRALGKHISEPPCQRFMVETLLARQTRDEVHSEVSAILVQAPPQGLSTTLTIYVKQTATHELPPNFESNVELLARIGGPESKRLLQELANALPQSRKADAIRWALRSASVAPSKH